MIFNLSSKGWHIINIMHFTYLEKDTSTFNFNNVGDYQCSNLSTTTEGESCTRKSRERTIGITPAISSHNQEQLSVCKVLYQ